jgi:hypothetical protein
VKDRKCLAVELKKASSCSALKLKSCDVILKSAAAEFENYSDLKIKLMKWEGQEFGAMVESKIEIAPGDRLESFKVVEK